jgi:formylglycine-generating enzyme required for sulfatase activity
MQTLSQSEFQVAFEHGAVQSVEIEPSGSRFVVKFLTLSGAAMLVQTRKPEPRLFGTVDGALKLLHKLGVRRIVLDRLEQWQPEQAKLVRRSRPDRAQALTRAAEYDRWVRAKVNASRLDPRPAMTEAEWESVRTAKRAERQALLSGKSQ